MKKIMVIIVVCVFVTGLKAQNTTNFCDPALESEINKICAMGGTFLKSFLISDKHYTAELVFREDIRTAFISRARQNLIAKQF